MWAIYSLLSALFGGTNAILAKRCVQKNNAVVVTALRTAVVLIISLGAVWVGGVWHDIGRVNGRSLLFLVLSGIMTAMAWFFYFRALEIGSVNHVAAVDKFSTVLTMIGGWLILGEPLGLAKVMSMILITAGILLMIERTSIKVDKAELNCKKKIGRGWFVWAVMSVIAVSVSTLLSKVGVGTVDSRLALAIRTTVVLLVSCCALFWKGRVSALRRIDVQSMCLIILSGAVTGFGWLFFFRALSLGDASVVHPIDKLSIFVTVVLSGIFLGERLRLKSGLGLFLLSIGISLLILL